MLESIQGGVRLHLFIQPKSSKNEIVGHHNGELKIKITAPPIDGRANEGLIEFLSDCFNTAKRNIVLVRGDSGRHKTVDIMGISKEDAEKMIQSNIR